MGNLVLRNSGGDEGEGGPLEIDGVHVALHVGDDISRNINARIILGHLLLDPLVVVSFFSSKSHVSTSLEQVPDEVLGLLGDDFPGRVVEVVSSVEHIIQYFVVVFASIWGFATQHDEHNYTHGPIIAPLSVTSLEHLRSNVVGCTVGHGHELVLIHLFSQTEIYQLDMRLVIGFVEQKVLRFDVSVADVILVQVDQRVEGLLHDHRGLGFGKSFRLRDMEEKLASLTHS